MKKQDWNIVSISECASTNDYLKGLKKNSAMHDRTALVTLFQTRGRGQSSNTWYSSKGSNLLISIYKKHELKAADNFLLNILTSLSLINVLDKFDIKCTIKWPNDIYFNEKKIAGILIENTIIRSMITESIIGIGLNINETNFPEWIPNPCSMTEITKIEYKIEDVCTQLLKEFDNQIYVYSSYGGEQLYHNYIDLLYRRNKWALFRKDSHAFNGRIHGVEPDGRLILETDAGQLHHFMFGDVEYVI